MDLERRRLGNGSLDFPNRLASQSLKDAQNAGYNMYEDHSDNKKRSPLLHKILYGTTMHIASLNVCSLLKSTMHTKSPSICERKILTFCAYKKRSRGKLLITWWVPIIFTLSVIPRQTNKSTWEQVLFCRPELGLPCCEHCRPAAGRRE